MRTNVVIDDELIAAAMASTGLKTKKAVIEEALRTLVRLKAREDVRSLRGQLQWEGDLNVMRESRFVDVDRFSPAAHLCAQFSRKLYRHHRGFML